MTPILSHAIGTSTAPPKSERRTSEIVNLLLVDDRPENLLALEAILADMGQNLMKANSGAEALQCLLKDDYAAILLDVQMPTISMTHT